MMRTIPSDGAASRKPGFRLSGSGARKFLFTRSPRFCGQSGYRFVLIAYDGDQPGGGGVDRFRIKITQGGTVIYDNRMGVLEDVDNADPTAIGGGSIVIHKGK